MPGIDFLCDNTRHACPSPALPGGRRQLGGGSRWAALVSQRRPPPPGSHRAPGWALPHAARRHALLVRWPAFGHAAQTRGSLFPWPGMEPTAPCSGSAEACQACGWLFWALLGQETEEGKGMHGGWAAGACEGPQGGAGGVGPAGFPAGGPAWSGCGRAPTVSIMVGDGPRPCWKASRKSPPAAPCLERAPPSLGTKGGVRSSGTCFLPGTCGPRNTLVTEPAHSLRPAPRSQHPVSTREPAARTGPAMLQVRKPRCCVCGGVVSNTRGGAEHSGSASCVPGEQGARARGVVGGSPEQGLGPRDAGGRGRACPGRCPQVPFPVPLTAVSSPPSQRTSFPASDSTLTPFPVWRPPRVSAGKGPRPDPRLGPAPLPSLPPSPTRPLTSGPTPARSRVSPCPSRALSIGSRRPRAWALPGGGPSQQEERCQPLRAPWGCRRPREGPRGCTRWAGAPDFLETQTLPPLCIRGAGKVGSGRERGASCAPLPGGKTGGETPPGGGQAGAGAMRSGVRTQGVRPQPALTQAGEMAAAPQALGVGTSLPASVEPAITAGLEKPPAWSLCSLGDAVMSHLVAVAAAGQGRDLPTPGRL